MTRYRASCHPEVLLSHRGMPRSPAVLCRRLLALTAFLVVASVAAEDPVSPGEAVREAVRPALAAIPCDMPAAVAASIDLPALSATERAWVADPESMPGPLRIGFGRAVPPERIVRGLWERRADGCHVLAVRVFSPGALGLRLGLSVEALPDSAVLGFSADGGSLVTTFAGAEVQAAPLSDDRDRQAETATAVFWSPLIPGEAAVLTLAAPAGVDPASVQLTVSRLSHVFRWPLDDSDAARPGEAACQIDAACEPAWDQVSRATALLVHTDETGSAVTCTGTLVSDADPATSVPYLLTAHHCVPDQQRAFSVEAVFFHRSARCGGSADRHRSVAGGADLLLAAKSTDTSLLRLRRAPPSGAVFASWSATLPEPGAALISVHHPQGLRQAIAFGTLESYEHCETVAYCGDDAAQDEAHYLRVAWDRGTTAAGSSGAGLFLPTGELVGVLTGGFGGCERPEGPDDYGRFGLAYRRGLQRWLGSP